MLCSGREPCGASTRIARTAPVSRSMLMLLPPCRRATTSPLPSSKSRPSEPVPLPSGTRQAGTKPEPGSISSSPGLSLGSSQRPAPGCAQKRAKPSTLHRPNAEDPRPQASTMVRSVARAARADNADGLGRSRPMLGITERTILSRAHGRMTAYTANATACQACGLCVKDCPEKAIKRHALR